MSISKITSYTNADVFRPGLISMTQKRFANTVIIICQNDSSFAIETQEDVHPEQFVQYTAGSRFHHEEELSFFFAVLLARINITVLR